MSAYQDRKLETYAYHEAGHAVAACLFGIPVTRVTLTPDPGPRDSLNRYTAAATQFNIKCPRWATPWSAAWDPKRGRKYIADNIQMTLAGPLAETIHTRCWVQQPGVDTDDEALAQEVASILTDSPKATRDWVNRLRFQMLETLQAPGIWTTVDAVAQALVESKTLDSADLYALVCATSGPPAEQGTGSAYRNHRAPR